MDDANARRVHAWIDSYIQAWNSNDPADIRALFTQDAAYHTEPYGPPGGVETRSCASGWTARTTPELLDAVLDDDSCVGA
jgi:hypothetical protein